MPPRASVFGTARINRAGSVEYRIDVELTAWAWGKDTYRLRLSSGYDSGAQQIRHGDVDIHPPRLRAPPPRRKRRPLQARRGPRRRVDRSQPTGDKGAALPREGGSPRAGGGFREDSGRLKTDFLRNSRQRCTVPPHIPSGRPADWNSTRRPRHQEDQLPMPRAVHRHGNASG
jgi:hypothetical protein